MLKTKPSPEHCNTMIPMNRSNLAPRDHWCGISDSARQQSDALAASVKDLKRQREAPDTGQRILVPVDLTRGSRLVTDYAMRLVAKSGGAVCLLHVVEPPSFLSGLDVIPLAKPDHQVIREIEEELEQLAGRAPEHLFAVEVLVRRGGVAKEICAVAKEIEADLIVMRNPRRRGWRRLLSSGTAERVIERAPCPVLTLRQRFLKKRAGRGAVDGAAKLRALVPVDFSANSAQSLHYGLRVAQSSDAELTLLRVVPPPLPAMRTSPDASRSARTRLLRDARQRLALWVAEQVKHPVTARLIVRFGQEPEAVIERMARNMNADLLVVGTRKFSRWRHLLRRSVVRTLLRRVTSPLLCLNATAAAQCAWAVSRPARFRLAGMRAVSPALGLPCTPLL